MNIVINLNKPQDLSSQQAVRKVKQLFTAIKAGHAGTLDPMATGVLLVCLNEATKITRFLSDLDKEYVARMKLGERTDTYDSTGKVIGRADYQAVTESDMRRILDGFTGLIKQTPPMYSAVKVGGCPLYKLARRGIVVSRPERTVTIDKIDLLSMDKPYVDLKILCSKGTYIRTLCDDVGNRLEVGAHMISLVRTRIGAFRIEDSLSFEDLTREVPYSCSIDSAISHLGQLMLDEKAYQKARNGVPVEICYDILLENQYVRLKSPENVLFGVGKLENSTVKIERLLN
jgi:tRNA pseudouridine55 synthase